MKIINFYKKITEFFVFISLIFCANFVFADCGPNIGAGKEVVFNNCLDSRRSLLDIIFIIAYQVVLLLTLIVFCLIIYRTFRKKDKKNLYRVLFWSVLFFLFMSLMKLYIAV
mgnify:CR=1 FL=1|jgi:uncharacterized membrane protein